MKKKISSLVICFFLLISFVSGCSQNESTPAQSPVTYYGELKVDGNRIVSSKTGRDAMVTGMSFFWSNWSADFYKTEYVDKMVNDMGCEIVRAAYGVDENGLPYNEADEALVKRIVHEAITKDIYVIIDWHSHGAHNNTDKAVDFFGRMAKEFGSYDNVIFEIYNEPTGVDWGKIKTYAQTVISEIRKYSDNLIIVGTPTWSQDVDVVASNPIDEDNIAYTLHFYAGTHGKELRNRADNALKKGIALFVTEWGSVNADGNGEIDEESTAEWINWCSENGISCCNWAINNKDEASSIYSASGSLSKTGKFIKEIIRQRTEKSEWRTGKPYSFEAIDTEKLSDAA